jgi:hypothetical protein
MPCAWSYANSERCDNDCAASLGAQGGPHKDKAAAKPRSCGHGITGKGRIMNNGAVIEFLARRQREAAAPRGGTDTGRTNTGTRTGRSRASRAMLRGRRRRRG